MRCILYAAANTEGMSRTGSKPKKSCPTVLLESRRRLEQLSLLHLFGSISLPSAAELLVQGEFGVTLLLLQEQSCEVGFSEVGPAGARTRRGSIYGTKHRARESKPRPPDLVVDAVDETSEESFSASDAPSWAMGTGEKGSDTGLNPETQGCTTSFIM
jgi:hypothetical protein